MSKKEPRDLLEIVRESRKANPYETDVQMKYRERLIAGSRKSYLREGEGPVEESIAEKLRAARNSENSEKYQDPDRALKEDEVEPSQKAYREKLATQAHRAYLHADSSNDE